MIKAAFSPSAGLEDLIECVCAAPLERRHYLCRLCKLTLGWHSVLKHILSLDHLHCYFVRNILFPPNCVSSL